MKRTKKKLLFTTIILTFIAIGVEVVYFMIIKFELYEPTIFNESLNRVFTLRIFTFLPGMILLGTYLYLQFHSMNDKRALEIIKALSIIACIAALFISLLSNVLYFYSLISGNPMMPVQQ